MKIIRLITLLITIPLLTSITYSSAIARDCSNPKGFHEKMMCKKCTFYRNFLMLKRPVINRAINPIRMVSSLRIFEESVVEF